MGAEEVSILYRRTRAEMPARREEVEHAVEEGVRILELVAPVSLSGDENGWLASATCVRMTLGEPDASGRRRPMETDSRDEIPCDQLIVAVGTGPNPVLLRNFPGLTLDKRGYIPVDGNGMTNLPGVFAGGDIVTGAATVIEAMGAGKAAARGIHNYLQTKNRK